MMTDPQRGGRRLGGLWWVLLTGVWCCFVALWVGCLPATAPSPGSGDGTGDGTVAGDTKQVNNAPVITITKPTGNSIFSVGDTFTIEWEDSDPDAGDNAVITIFLDPDATPGSGNEILIQAGIPEDPDGGANDSVVVDTELLGIPVGTYRIVALIQDAAGNSVTEVPDFTIQILPEGISPGNDPPKIKFLQPTENLGVVQGDQVCVQWTGSDADTPTATVTLSLDYDLDPTNDDPNDPNTILILGTGLPLSGTTVDPNTVDPNTVDPNTVDPNAADPNCSFLIDVDTTRSIEVTPPGIPPREGGLPYFIRADVDDGVNPPVIAYAIGWITVQAWAEGVVDLGDAGLGLAGAIFQGFHGKVDPLDANQVGGLAGSWATTIGDLDGDGYDDFIVAARYSNPRGRGFIGQAYMLYGRSTRFSSVNSLNSVGLNMRGCQFHGAKNWSDHPIFGNGGQGGNGGLASVTFIDDLDGDDKPEMIFGFPDVYTDEEMDYDPLDKDDLLYIDDFRLPFSDNHPHDDWGYDWFSMVVMVSSNQEFDVNRLEGNAIDLQMVGQRDPEGVSNDELVGMVGSIQPRGVRFRGEHPQLLGATRFGETVAAIPDTDADGVPELLFSVPEGDNFLDLLLEEEESDKRGRIDVYLGRNFEAWHDLPVKSIPEINAVTVKIGDEEYGDRFFTWPVFYSILGESPDDHLGRALHAGDFNQDGSPDIACGAIGADRNGLTDNGIAYIAFGQLVIGELKIDEHPRIEILGSSDGDQLGETQCGVGDFNGDSIDDVGLGSAHFDPNGTTDAGFAAVLFGGRRYTGERTYDVHDIATPALPGVKFIGSNANAMAGAMVNSAGDFNGDGRNDIIISAPGEEYRFQAGGSTQTRVGVCYLIFGNNNLLNKTFTLDEVGTAELPGIVFVSPYEKGTADQAGVDTCFKIGDINGDGYDEIIIGNTTADYVNPANPSQRRVDAGEAYVIYGNNFSGNNPNNW